jgi:branched-chain amino acid transport system ATP-binding protein
MNFSIALSLIQEGLTNGAIYSLIALALVLVFAVTRVILVQAGELVSYGALTIYTLQNNRTPMTLWFMLAACVFAGGLELNRLRMMQARTRDYARPLIGWWIAPLLVTGVTLLTPKAAAPVAVQALLTLAIVVPLAMAMYRLVYQPVARASILVLLIISVACHFVLDGLALLAFGPDGARTAALSEERFDVAGESVSVQSLIVLAVSVLLVAVLYWFSKRTMAGRALRATASNRRGASLMGISTDMAGLSSFSIAALICATAGILIAPFVTIYYNSGFLISLKAFVGATMGAMASYPLAGAGALTIGLFESFAAFWSSAYKDSLVFALMVPILLGCSLLARPAADDEQERLEDPQARKDSFIARFQRTLQRIPPRAAGFVLLAALLVLPIALSRFYVTMASYVFLFAIVAYGVVLLTGIAGQVSFGQAAFVGIGAYVSAVLTTSCAASEWVRHALGPVAGLVLGNAACGLSPWFALVPALAATMVCAWLLGAVTLRMHGHYLPIATIAWSVSIFYLFSNTDAIGASTGMTDLPALPLPFGVAGIYEARIYYLILIITLAIGWMTRNLLDSRTGRAIRALKSRSAMAESVGVDIASLKIKVFVCAAVYAAASGWLYAHMQRFINPASFGLDKGVEYVFMAVVGGVDQVSGAILGSVAVRVMNDVIQNTLQLGVFEKIGNMERVVFGVLIIVMLQRTQHGLALLLRGFARRARVPQPRRQDTDETETISVAGAAGPILEVEGVSKQFGGLVAVSGVSFEVSVGEIVAVIGPNGAGKSTIFNLVSGALGLTSGTIRFAGKRIDTLPSCKIADAGLSRTFQHVKLLPELSALENAALGAYRHGKTGMLATLLRLDRVDEQRALEDAMFALKRVGLGDAALANAGSLPLGKQRILEIARALASHPRMLLLDEPAAGLRAAEKRELAALMRDLRQEGVAILLVEHDMAFVMELADRVIVQNFGRTLTTGAPAEVQAHPEVMTAYLGVAA